MQKRDAEKGNAEGKTAKQGPDGTKGSRGGRQPASKGSKGEQEADGTKGSRGAPQHAGKGSKGLKSLLAQRRRLNKFLEKQRLKRWCWHLQRVCGSKHMWEVLAFSGRFDVVMLSEALEGERREETAEPPARDAWLQGQRRLLVHCQAEANALYNEGQRLAWHRDARWRRSAAQPASRGQEVPQFTLWERQVLQQWDSGELRATRDILQIGGSTGCGSRRIRPGWRPRDWRQFQQDE